MSNPQTMYPPVFRHLRPSVRAETWVRLQPQMEALRRALRARALKNGLMKFDNKYMEHVGSPPEDAGRAFIIAAAP